MHAVPARAGAARFLIHAVALSLAVAVLPWSCSTPRARNGSAFARRVQPVWVAVMDPLARELACECVAGYAQRDYVALARYLTEALGVPVRPVFCEGLVGAQKRIGRMPDLVIGKQSVIRFDAEATGTGVTRLAVLTGRDGLTTLRGLLVVRADDPAKTLADLSGRVTLFGPEEADEKHAAAFAALRAAAVPIPREPKTSAGCSAAALAVVEKRADAAVLSSYAMPLLTGCDVIDKGALRVIGQTLPVPFVAAFATDQLSREEREAVAKALLEMRKRRALLKKLETRDGFMRTAAAQSRTE